MEEQVMLKERLNRLIDNTEAFNDCWEETRKRCENSNVFNDFIEQIEEAANEANILKEDTEKIIENLCYYIEIIVMLYPQYSDKIIIKALSTAILKLK